MKKYLFWLITLLMCNGCDGCEEADYIYMHNNSKKYIYVATGYGHPDTTLTRNYVFDPRHRYKAAPFTNIKMTENSWKSKFNYNIDTLFIFIFDSAAIYNVSVEDIGKNYLVLQRYDLSLGDLQRLNWTVTYPPTAAMKDMKMYPSYKDN